MSRSNTTILPRNVRETARRTSSQGISEECLAADVAAFQAAGGTIEVLGNTRTLKHIHPEGNTVEPALD